MEGLEQEKLGAWMPVSSPRCRSVGEQRNLGTSCNFSFLRYTPRRPVDVLEPDPCTSPLPAYEQTGRSPFQILNRENPAEPQRPNTTPSPRRHRGKKGPYPG